METQVRELAKQLGRDGDELVEWWAERAAIRELEGGQSHNDAERDAFEELRETFEPAVIVGERKGPRSIAIVASTPAKREES